jgi:hypothetical protein
MFYGLSAFSKTGPLCRFRRNVGGGATDVTFHCVDFKEDIKYEFVVTEVGTN